MSTAVYDSLVKKASTQIKNSANDLKDGQGVYFTTDKASETNKKSSVLLEKSGESITASMKSADKTISAVFSGDTVTPGQVPDGPQTDKADTQVLQAVVNHVTPEAEKITAKSAKKVENTEAPPVSDTPTGTQPADETMLTETETTATMPLEVPPAGSTPTGTTDTSEFTDTASFRV